MTSIALRSRQFARSIEQAFRHHVLARLASQKEYLVLNSAPYTPGLFSEFAAVLGMLHHYERSPWRYAGLKVDFGRQGLYFDASAGENWWQYYFERLEIGSDRGARPRVVVAREQAGFAAWTERKMAKETASELIARHIRVKRGILDAVESYVRQHFAGFHVVGVHYRGTDKGEEAPRVPFQAVDAAVRDAIRGFDADRVRLFLATDEQPFLEFMSQRYPRALLYREMFRSSNGEPIHERNESNYRKGEDAVIDCLLLSRSDHLIRTASNLSLFATFLNPRLPALALNRER
jgi:hypothetical protein